MFSATPARKLMFIMFLTAIFFVLEIGTGMYTHSLALIADAFHYLFDFGSYLVAYTAMKLQASTRIPEHLPFGYARAELIGSFVNGITLAALGFSIFVQSLQRFVVLDEVQHPMLMLIVGCIGLLLNLVSLVAFHQHTHLETSSSLADSEASTQASSQATLAVLPPIVASSTEGLPTPNAPGRHDHGFRALFLHVLSDAAANIGVIMAAAIIWKTHFKHRFYVDPALSLTIAFLTFGMSIPLIKRTAKLLAGSRPASFQHERLVAELKRLDSVVSVHAVRIWQLNFQDSIASVHAVVNDQAIWALTSQMIKDCFYRHGVHDVTIEVCEWRHCTK